jgi:Zn-dependent protease
MDSVSDTVRRLVFTLVPMILSLSVHEFAHALCAYKLGDPTAKEAGRLTLNPQSHVDPVGTLLIPGLAAVMGGVPFIGWARPTPFRADRFREGVNQRFGSALVSVAGPLSNVFLALLSIGILAGLARAHVHLQDYVRDGDELVPRPTGVGMLLITMFQLNLGLAFFNLLPIPPLDGFRLLPPQLDPIMRPVARYGFAVLMGVMFFLPSVANRVLYAPLSYVTGHIAEWFLP